MPGRGRSSFTKRQKEHSRQEKRREKEERKNQRKLEKQAGTTENIDSSIESAETQAALFRTGQDEPDPLDQPIDPDEPGE